ncbi:hypothetical protein D0U04_18125 [Bacillus clarus]|uniref:Uncharacterized protein n=1 Tax=Bacillus clarus TaxID=2338372 RepID=A0ABX9KSM9_9BACI|nr:hypothetical protein D0U04_18125 [Bacillus clarus]
MTQATRTTLTVNYKAKEVNNNKIQVDTVRYVRQTSHGFKIEMIIKNNEIITGYPVYTRR